MRTVVNEELRDTIRVLCMVGVDYYEVVDTETDTVVAIDREINTANKICAEFNSKNNTMRYAVNFVNN